MTLTLAQMRTHVLAALDDTGQIYYTNAQIDSAIRQTLEEYSRQRSQSRTYAATSDGLKRQALPASFNAMSIMHVEYRAPGSVGTIADRLAFYATRQNEQWIIEFADVTPPAGTIYWLTYTVSHLLDGLDGAAGTSIEPDDLYIFAIGAAGYAQLARAASRTEANNLNADTVKHLRESGNAKIAVMRRLSSAAFITARWTR